MVSSRRNLASTLRFGVLIMKLKISLGLFLTTLGGFFVSTMLPTLAQACASCAGEGGFTKKTIQAYVDGTIFLAALPFVIIGVLVFIAFRMRKSNLQKPTE